MKKKGFAAAVVTEEPKEVPIEPQVTEISNTTATEEAE